MDLPYLPHMSYSKYLTTNLSLSSNKYKVVIAGGQGQVSGKIFRIGHMGEVREIHILGTLAAIEMAFKELGYNASGGVDAAKEVLGM